MRTINILDTTLRDGSYALNFSFSSDDTRNICRALEHAGVEYIEIGHGVGLNASNMGYGKALQTDEEYMQAASETLKVSKFGMFCIPGIARLEDIDLAAQYNMGFIRVGTNVTEVETSKEFIAKAKKHGMFVAANFMKSYAMHPKEFAEKVKEAEAFGADMIYIVDSAGGMFFDAIKSYYEEIRKVSNISIGFHGHDNLCLAVSNSIQAVQLGFDFVDGSLQGLGRSAGNAATETLVASFMRLGFLTGIDFFSLLEVGQKYIRPMIKSQGRSMLDIVAGFSQFHSSYMPYITRYSKMYEVNPVALIIEVSKVDKVNVTDKMVEQVANRLREKSCKELY